MTRGSSYYSRCDPRISVHSLIAWVSPPDLHRTSDACTSRHKRPHVRLKMSKVSPRQVPRDQLKQVAELDLEELPRAVRLLQPCR
jgi:hypothetical protein